MADETTESDTGLSDNPVKETGRDWLGFGGYVSGLAKLLEGVETPFVLGVFGDWGVGKTSLMHLLREKMKGEDHATVWFNAWKYHGREDVWKALVRAVYYEVCERLGFFKWGRGHVLRTLREAAKPAANVIGRALKLGAVGDEFEGLMSLDSIYQNVFEAGLSRRINQLLPREENKRLVVFIDDLDRCSPPAIVEVLEALKLYLDIERCVFVLGADEAVVSKVVEHEYGMHEGGDATDEDQKAKPLVEGRAYLQKIVQVPFHVPPMDEEQLGKFIAKLVEVAPGPHGVDAGKWDEYLKRVARATVNNPRQIKRFALTVKLLDTISPDTVSFEREGSVVEREFDRLKVAKLVLLQFVAAAFYDTVKRLPGVLYYRQQEAIEARQGDYMAEAVRVIASTRQQAIDPRDECDTQLKGGPGGAVEHGPPTSDDLLDQILAEEPLWESPEEATCYVTVSAGSVAGPRPGGPEDFAQVQQDLLSDDYSVRRAAADILLEGGAEEVQRHVDALIQRLTGDEQESVRANAALALGKIGTERAVQPLIHQLSDDEPVTVRGWVAVALGMIGHEEAVEPLIRTLTEDEDSDVRRAAAEALGSIGHERAVQPLLRRLTEDGDEIVRANAAWALGAIRHEEAVQPLIRSLTEDEDENVRWRAAAALGEIGGVEAEKALREARDQEPEVHLRTGIEGALREIEKRGGEDTGEETGPEDGGSEE